MLRWIVVLLVGLGPGAFAQVVDDLPDLSGIGGHLAEGAPPASGVYRSGLGVPRVDPGATASRVARQLGAALAEETGAQEALGEIERQMPLALEALEGQLEGVGFARRDLGVAAAYALITLWETAQAETIPQEPSIVAGRTIGDATAQHWDAAYRRLPGRQQEATYEALMASAMLLEAFATQFEGLGLYDQADAMRQTAAETFEAVFGVPPDAVRVRADGRLTGLPSGGPGALATDTATPAPRPIPRSAPTPGSVSVTSPLPAASANGAEVYIKYTWSYGMGGFEANQDPLVLFPDGTAVEWMPRGGVAAFTPAGIRAAFEDPDDRRRFIGTWRRAGDRITLDVDGETRVLRKTPRGWWDDEDPIDTETGYDTYFPVILATPERLLGPWITSSLFVSGTAGGALPMVASGSTTNRVFYADGTFAEDEESFVSATSANVGDAFSTGADVSVFSENAGQAAGRWRLDGPLLTLEKEGERRIMLAFVMPEWTEGDTDVWVGRDFWERPGEDD